MNILPKPALLAPLLLALATLSSACSREAPIQAASRAESFITDVTEKAINEASRKIETENIPIGQGFSFGSGKSFSFHGSQGLTFNVDGDNPSAHGDDKLPKAEISPQGDLLIGGEAITLTPGQREQVLAYRGQLIGIAQAGMQIGTQGAGIAGKAVGGLGKALFGGEEGRKEYEREIEVEAAKIEQEALKLCVLLPPLFDSQQALAESLPEFAPYATLTQKAIDDCGSKKTS